MCSDTQMQRMCKARTAKKHNKKVVLHRCFASPKATKLHSNLSCPSGKKGVWRSIPQAGDYQMPLRTDAIDLTSVFTLGTPVTKRP